MMASRHSPVADWAQLRFAVRDNPGMRTHASGSCAPALPPLALMPGESRGHGVAWCENMTLTPSLLLVGPSGILSISSGR